METVFALAILATYLYGAGRLIRWGAAKSDQKVPGWWDAIGTVLIPPMVGRATRWVIPDAWGWPDQLLGAAVGALCFYLLLRCLYNFKARYTVLTIVLVYGLALVMMLKMLPLILSKDGPGPGGSAPIAAPGR